VISLSALPKDGVISMLHEKLTLASGYVCAWPYDLLRLTKISSICNEEIKFPYRRATYLSAMVSVKMYLSNYTSFSTIVHVIKYFQSTNRNACWIWACTKSLLGYGTMSVGKFCQKILIVITFAVLISTWFKCSTTQTETD
jgi:hypothetical protein